MSQLQKEYKNKLYGWLSYAFASEVFVIVSLTLFLPICLEQFARDNGYLLPDKTARCSTLKPPESTGRAAAADEVEAARCVVKIGWLWIDTASFSLYTYSISVALQALTVISMGGIADHPTLRKKLLLVFAALGSIAASGFLALPSSSTVWFLSCILAIFANVGFGASTVAMNAYLPSLAYESESVAMLRQQLQDFDAANPRTSAESDDDHCAVYEQEAPLLNSSSFLSDAGERKVLETLYHSELARKTSHISSLGIALGYGSGILLLIVALVPVTKLHGSAFALRLAIGLSGIWWAVFSVPAAVWLPSASVSARQENALDEKEWTIGGEIVAAWIRLGNMLRWSEIKKLRNTFKYLAAWFLLSDGFTTITSTALLFGKTTLRMSASALILVGVLTPLSGILGSLLWPALQRKFKWSSQTILVILVVMASMIPAYGCLGFVLQGRVKFGGLTTQEEMFALAVYFGSVYGAFQGYARAFYAKLLPPGEEARWYGLYSITDKSSSFIGPLVVGVISDMTGNIRYSFFFLIFMVWAAVPLLLSVDADRGWQDAQQYKYQASSSQ
ncbi:MFS general substrate transporter [Crepidotus variabilis]|uniref:Autophagy-related protein n=1 Tax=Crepidotus variabilis TaxID=179855 RepID=A0A9P6JKG1_9AGAR|nr:MFS general substrate transporter [Crepidotus variabilis]